MSHANASSPGKSLVIAPHCEKNPSSMTPSVQRVAIGGLGSIGRAIASRLDRGDIPGVELAAVAARDREKAAQFLRTLSRPVPIVELEALGQGADIVIECAPAELLPRIALPALGAGRKVVVLSVGALLSNPEITQVAVRNGGQVLVPTGALIGLDAVAAAAEGTIRSVRMTTRKPVNGLLGAPYLVENKIDISRLREPLKVFSGTAREAAKGFPANLNVAVALSLAGIGPDATLLEIWADPHLTRNMHRIDVEADSATFTMTIENVPSENPKTGRITALSVIALLRRLNAPLRIGT
jgi:aspartate dehydrogenase